MLWRRADGFCQSVLRSRWTSVLRKTENRGRSQRREAFSALVGNLQGRGFHRFFWGCLSCCLNSFIWGELRGVSSCISDAGSAVDAETTQVTSFPSFSLPCYGFSTLFPSTQFPRSRRRVVSSDTLTGPHRNRRNDHSETTTKFVKRRRRA